MEPFGGNYYNNYRINNHEEYNNQYYDPFYVKHRKRTTKAQLKILEQTFESCPRPDSIMRKKLGDQLNMTPRSVQVWFQNRRAKVKKQQMMNEESKNSPMYNQMYRMPYMKPYDQYEIYPTNNNVLSRSPGPYMYDNTIGYPLNYSNYNEEPPFNLYEQRYDKKTYPYE